MIRSAYLRISMESRAIFLIFFFSSALHLSSVISLSNGLFSNKADKEALLGFKLQITDDPFGVLRSWNDTNDFCSWEGISCGKKNRGRVVSINLDSKGLTGYISSSVHNLTFLHYLNLNQNKFSGTVQPSLFTLPRLRVLNLRFNSLYGEIPFNLSSSLTNLNLSGNYISGSIPSSLGHLPNLKSLALFSNNLTGKIPPSLGNLSSLQVLNLYGNQLEGSVPEEIGNHQSLKLLLVSENNLSGELPASIFNLSSAYCLAMAANNFKGMIPSTFGNNLPNLQLLYMGANQFKGWIPVSLTNASKLSLIDMSSNNFNGMIPSNLGRLRDLSLVNFGWNQLEASDRTSWRFFDALTNCSQLEILILENNKLSGTLPNSFVNISISIQWISIQLNGISGSIQSEVGNLINLMTLYLGFNLLTGVVPESICKLTRLQELGIDGNMLTGVIPSSIGNLSQILFLYVSGNGFKGPIPPSIGNMKSLVKLHFDHNNFNGNIPKEIFELSSVSILGLSSNALTGPIPSKMGGLKDLRELYLYGNRLFGEIPTSISSCLMLETLDLSSNLIHGTIPPSMGILKGLIALDLSENNLTGTIPKVLGQLKSLQYFNVSFNHLVGEVPMEGVFLNATATSLQGNYGLCGGVSNLHLLACPHIKSSRKRRPMLLLLAILLPFITGFSLILILILCFFCRRKNIINNTSTPKIMEDIYPKITYADLMRATDGFSPANLLGVGQYCSVYKGSLDNYGYPIVAVKVFNLQQRGASRSFLAECEALRQIRHRNLVKILTCCVGIDSKGDDFMAIVFEFMQNGNLDTWLHADNMEPLDLIKRLNIALNIAHALCYLHYECETQIVHCDLKPSNVLLNGDMVAHLGDFGLARLLHKIVSSQLNDSNHSYSMIKGSIGYVAPEYGLGSEVSIMGDVYSYGILLSELFTGRRPVDKKFRDGLNLRNFVDMATPHRIMEVIDPILLHQFNNEDDNGIQSRRATYECLISILQLSLLCSKELARERISMEEVVVELNSIRDVYFKASLQ